MRTKIIIIRHGETAANKERRYIGITDSLLSARGRRQGVNLKERMAKEKIDKIFVSPSKRTLDFSKIVFGARKKEIVPDLREMNFGIFEGLTHTEMLKKYPGIYRKWLKDPCNFNIPEAEAFKDFKVRVFKVFKKIVSNNNQKTIALVTHGGPIRIILSELLSLKDIKKVTPALASVIIIETGQNNTRMIIKKSMAGIR